MDFFIIDRDLFEVSTKWWIYLVCTLPLTFVVLGGSHAWMWWTGTKVKKPYDYYFGEKLANAANMLGLGIGA